MLVTQSQCKASEGKRLAVFGKSGGIDFFDFAQRSRYVVFFVQVIVFSMGIGGFASYGKTSVEKRKRKGKIGGNQLIADLIKRVNIPIFGFGTRLVYHRITVVPVLIIISIEV